MARLVTVDGLIKSGAGYPFDYFLDISKGKIPNHSFQFRVGQNDAVGTGGAYLTDEGNTDALPTSAETWEIVSTNAADTFGTGAGAWAVLVPTLDGSYNRQSQVVNLNGLTPVVLTGTHLRAEVTVVVAVGTPFGSNLGDLIIRPQGGGSTRARILVGNGVTRTGIYTVPAGKTAYIRITPLLSGKNDSGRGSILTTTPDTLWALQDNGDIPIVSGAAQLTVTGYLGLPEKTDYILKATSDSGTGRFVGIATVVEVDNKEIL